MRALRIIWKRTRSRSQRVLSRSCVIPVLTPCVFGLHCRGCTVYCGQHCGFCPRKMLSQWLLSMGCRPAQQSKRHSYAPYCTMLTASMDLSSPKSNKTLITSVVTPVQRISPSSREWLRVRFHIIRNARIDNVGKYQLCMVSKLPIIWKQTVGSSTDGASARHPRPTW